MAQLEQLNFEVILNDVEFNNKIGEMLKKANDLNTTLSNLLSIKGTIMPITAMDVQNAKNMNKILQDNYRLQQQMARMQSKTNRSQTVDNAAAQAEAQKEITKQKEQEAREIIKTQMAQERLNRLQREGNSILGKSSRLWREVGSMAAAYFSIRGATSLIRTLTQVTAEFEMQRVTLGAILNDSQAAGKLFDQLKELAVRSPFQFKDLATYAKQLSAYSIPVNELYETTKMLADVSAGLGVGMDRLVLAYGQIRSASFLRGQEVRQLTEAGIPILVELRKQFVELGEEGITVADVFDKISKRMVPFEMVEKVFKDMTSEGGKFFEMQEVQADTLKGKISNLTDAYQIMFSEIGDKKQGLLKGAVDMARSLAENYQKVGRTLTTLIVTYGAYKTLMALIIPLQKAHMLATIAQISQMKALGAVMLDNIKKTQMYKALMSTFKTWAANPWVLVGAAVAAVGTYLTSAAIQAAKFRKELNGVIDAQMRTADKAVAGFKDLVNQLRSATEGSQNYRDAISKLNNQYGEYLPNLLNEKNALMEIAKAEETVTNAIYARARAYAEAEGLQKIEDKEGKKMSEAANSLIKALRGRGMAEEVVDDFIKGFRDNLKSKSGSIEGIFSNTLEEYLGVDLANKFENTFVAVDNTRAAVQAYGVAVRDLTQAEEDYNRTLDLRFGTKGYSSVKEREYIKRVEAEFSARESAIRDQELSAEETEQKLLDNKIAKLNAMLDTYKQLNKEAADLGKEGAWDNQIRDIQNQLDALKPGDDSWLMKLVKPVAKAGGQRDLIAQMGDQYDEYADKLRKEYKDVTETLEDAQKTYNGLVEDKKKGLAVDDAVLQKAKEQYEYLDKRQDTIENIGKALHISVNDKMRKASSGGSSGKSAEQVELEMRRDTLKDILKWYDKLRDAGMDSESIKSLLSAYFPEQNDIIVAENYKDALNEVADALERYDKKAAQALRDDLGLNGIDQEFEKWKKAKDAADKYKDFMEKWLDSSELFGEGSEFNISKIINKYKKSVQEIENKRKEAIELLYEEANTKGVFGLGYLEKGREIDQKALDDSTNALKQANEDVRKEAEKWVKSWDGLSKFDLSHMADLTARELTQLQDKLAELAANPESYFDGFAEDLKEAGLDIEVFKEAVLKAIDDINSQAEEKKWANIVKQVKRYKQALDSSVSALKSLATAAKDPYLQGLADQLDKTADAALRIVENLAEGDTFGVIMAAGTYLVEVWSDAVTASLEFKNVIEDLKLEFMEMKYAADLAMGVDSIFGTDTYRSLVNANNLAASLTSKMSNLKSVLDSITVSTNNSKWWEFLLAPTAPAAWAKLLTNRSISISELLEQTGAQLRDERGRINVEALERIRDSYTNLSKSEKAAFDQAIIDAKAYNDALDQLDADMKSLVGSIAGDFADAIIKQWKEAGNAAADYGDILDDLATQYAKLMISNILLDKVFDDDFKNAVTQATVAGESARVLSLFDQKVQELEQYYPFFEEVLSGLSQYFTDEEASKSTLGNGVKSITEDTANLLASYINAIRADVSAIRQAIVAGGAQYLPAPTLAEYLTQIQANTYNTANNTAQLLERINSVMTISDGPAIRVFM